MLHTAFVNTSEEATNFQLFLFLWLNGNGTEMLGNYCYIPEIKEVVFSLPFIPLSLILRCKPIFTKLQCSVVRQGMKQCQSMPAALDKKFPAIFSSINWV